MIKLVIITYKSTSCNIAVHTNVILTKIYVALDCSFHSFPFILFGSSRSLNWVFLVTATFPSLGNLTTVPSKQNVVII